MSSLPNNNTYYVVPDLFLAGEYPGESTATATRRKIQKYLDCGVEVFVDLTEENELAPYEDILREKAEKPGVPVNYYRLPIQDLSVPGKALMKEILDSIDDAVSLQRKVYVHCWGGIGRTGTVVGCYLVRHGSTGEEALRQIAIWWQTVEKCHRRPDSPETEEQCKYVRCWSEK